MRDLTAPHRPRATTELSTSDPISPTQQMAPHLSNKELETIQKMSGQGKAAQQIHDRKDFVLVVLHRGGPRSSPIGKTLCFYCSTRKCPKGAQTHSAHNAHRSSSQCSLEETTVLTVLISNK